MASYILKAKNLDLVNQKNKKTTIGRFYSGDRFYTLLNEYIDVNLHKKSRFMAWLIKVLFKSGNYKHDPGIANGQPWSVKLFDWFCILCLIIFVCLAFGFLGPIIDVALGKKAASDLIGAFSGLGVGALITGIPGIGWLIMYFTIRKKNKPLSLQAYVEKKISFCLMLRFLIKNTKRIKGDKDSQIMLLENFEAQGASGPRWLNIQMINLICSIFPEFNYMFRFESLSDEELAELKPIIDYDFRMVEIIGADDLQWEGWTKKEQKHIFKKQSKTKVKDSIQEENKVKEE